MKQEKEPNLDLAKILFRWVSQVHWIQSQLKSRLNGLQIPCAQR